MYYREGNIRISSAWDVDHNEIKLEVRIPRETLVGMDRRRFADMMYDVMVQPLDVLADPLVRRQYEEIERVREMSIRLNSKKVTPAEVAHIATDDTDFRIRDQKQIEAEIGVVPDGLRVFYCATCKEAVTFDDETAGSYDNWFGIISSIFDGHDH